VGGEEDKTGGVFSAKLKKKKKKRHKSHPKSFYDLGSLYDVLVKQGIFCSACSRSSLKERKDSIRQENKTSAPLGFVFEGHLQSHKLHVLPTCQL